MIIRQPTDGERWLEKHGIWFARALLRRESRQRHLFEAWLRDYRVQEARRKAGEFDKPVDTQAILAEARAELAETEAMLKKYNID